MNDINHDVPEFLRPPCDASWHWADNESICWVKDEYRTITFAPHVKLVLQRLRETLGGFPSLTAVVLVLDACSDRWNADVASQLMVDLANECGRPRADLQTTVRKWLHRIHWLARELRSHLDSQVAILNLALSELPSSLLETADEPVMDDIVSCLGIPADQRAANWSLSASATVGKSRSLVALDTIKNMTMRPISAESIELWKATHLVVLPEATEVELPPQKPTVSSAINSLLDDQNWRGMAQTAMSFASLVSLPRRPSDPEILPIGGVSDITNRGNPDRLLLTELGQDPLMMLARIANGQALYLRREVPPGPSPPIRPLFLESSIRCWGIRRVQIAAIGLAIALAEESRGESVPRIFTNGVDQFCERDFTTKQGVVDHLSELSTAEHPGESIHDWFHDSSDDSKDWAEPILVVTAATDHDPRFRACCDSISSQSLLIFRLERDETATLIKRTRLGDEIVQSISLQFPGDDIKPRQRVAITSKSSLPTFFCSPGSAARFFGDQLNETRWVSATKQGLYAISRDFQLLVFDQPGRAARELLPRVPSPVVLAESKSEDSIKIIVGDQSRAFLISVEDQTPNVIQLASPCENVYQYEFSDQGLFRIGKWIELLDQSTGEVRDRIEAEMPSIGAGVGAAGPYLKVYQDQGGKIKVHDFEVRNSNCRSYIHAIRDTCGVIHLISRDWSELVSLESDVPAVQSLGPPVSDLSARPAKQVYRSASGNQVIFQDRHSARAKGVDLQDKSIIDISANTAICLYRLDPDLYPRIHPEDTLKRVSSVGFSFRGIHLFKGYKQWNISTTVTPGNLMLVKAASGQAINRHPLSSPVSIETPWGKTIWKTRDLKIGDNLITLDSRGFLHLQSGDGSAVSLALQIAQVSGWSSWGESFGWSKLVGDEPTVSPGILDWIQDFCSRCLAVELSGDEQRC